MEKLTVEIVLNIGEINVLKEVADKCMEVNEQRTLGTPNSVVLKNGIVLEKNRYACLCSAYQKILQAHTEIHKKTAGNALAGCA